MGKPAFDPNKPFKAVDKPAFDPNQPFDTVEENYLSLEQPGFLKSAAQWTLGKVEDAGRFVDSYTGAPTRAAIGAYQDNQSPLAAFAQQFGENPDIAPSGKQIATKAGLDTKNPVLTAAEQAKFDQMYAPNMYQERMRMGGYKDQEFPSKAGIAGLAIDVSADPTNIFAGEGLIRGAIGGGAKLAKGAGRVVKGADEMMGVSKAVSKAATSAGEAAKATTVGAIATDTAKTIKRTMDDFFHPKQAENFGHWVSVADANGIDPNLLPESIEFGPNSSISRMARHVRENPMIGEPDMEKFRNGLMQVDQAIDNNVARLSGGPPLNDIEAGDVLRAGHDRAVNDLFNRTDFTYQKVIDQAPEASVTPKSIEMINKKFAKLKAAAENEAIGAARKETRNQAKNLLEDLQAIRTRMSQIDPNTKTFGSMQQLKDVMTSVGKDAFSKTKFGEIPFNQEAFKDLYFTMRDAFVNSTAENLGADVANALIDTNQQITMFNKDIEPIAKMLNKKEVSPEKLFQTLVARGDSKQIGALKEILSPEEFNQLRGAYLNRFITRNSDDTIHFGALRSKLAKNTTTLSVLFQPNEIENIVELSKLGEKWGPAVLSTSGTGASNLLRDSLEALKSGATSRATLELSKKSARGRSALDAAEAARVAEEAAKAAEAIPESLKAIPAAGETLTPVQRFMQARQRGKAEEIAKIMQMLATPSVSSRKDERDALEKKLKALQGQ